IDPEAGLPGEHAQRLLDRLSGHGRAGGTAIPGSAWWRSRGGSCLSTVVVRVPWHGALDAVAQALPGVARSVLRVLPFERRTATRAAPVATQVGLDVVEVAIGISRIRIDTVAIGGRVVVVARPAPHVRPARVVVAPVRLFGRRIDRLGGTLAGHGADDGAG